MGASSEALKVLARDYGRLFMLVSVDPSVLAQLPSSFSFVLPMETGREKLSVAATPLRDALRPLVDRWTFALEVSRRAAQLIVLDRAPLTRAAVVSVASALAGAERRVALASPLSQSAASAESVGGEDAVLRGCLYPLCAALITGVDPTIVWLPDLFLDGDHMGEHMPKIIEVAGRPRILCYGPYLPLPTGRWQITVTMGFNPEINQLPFIIEFDVGEVVARGFFQPVAAGFFDVTFTAVIEKPLHPAELRVISQDTALEGQFALIEVSFRPWIAHQVQSAA